MNYSGLDKDNASKSDEAIAVETSNALSEMTPGPAIIPMEARTFAAPHDQPLALTPNINCASTAQSSCSAEPFLHWLVKTSSLSFS